MDYARWDTGQVLANGVLDRAIPKTGIPEDRDFLELDVCEMPTAQAIAEALDAGLVASCSEYYGIPYAWKEGDRYRGVLLQYRNVTEDETFPTALAAAGWIRSTSLSVAG